MPTSARPAPLYRTLLVPLDGSPFAEQALPMAVAIARRARASIRLVLVHIPSPPSAAQAAQRSYASVELAARKGERAYLRSVAARIRPRTGAAVSPLTLVDARIGPALAEFVAEGDVDLVVMATHGRGGLERAWLGSVADFMVRTVAVPLVLVRPRDDAGGALDEPRIGELLVPLDGSARAAAILEHATALARLFGAGLHVAQVVEPVPLLTEPPDAFGGGDLMLVTRQQEAAHAYVGEVAASLRRDGLAVTATVEIGRPAERLLDLAARRRVGMIAVATHGRSGVRRGVLGSVADKLVRAAGCPVFVYRPARSSVRP